MDAVLADVYSDGLLDGSKAVLIIPAATGVEDGVNYVEFHNLTSFSSFVYFSTTNSTALPVSLSHFNVSKSENTAVLKWTTASEENSMAFEVQRSADSKNWNFITRVSANVNSNAEKAYQYVDIAPLSGSNYYRLKMVDADNTFAFSSIRYLKFDGAAGTVLYPNPVSNRLLFKNIDVEKVARVLVYDQNGHALIDLGNITAEGIDVSALPMGAYIVKIRFDEGSAKSFKIIVQK